MYPVAPGVLIETMRPRIPWMRLRLLENNEARTHARLSCVHSKCLHRDFSISLSFSFFFSFIFFLSLSLSLVAIIQRHGTFSLIKRVHGRRDIWLLNRMEVLSARLGWDQFLISLGNYLIIKPCILPCIPTIVTFLFRLYFNFCLLLHGRINI